MTQAAGVLRADLGRLLVASFIGVALGYSSTYFYSSGLFLLPLSDAFGLTRAEVSLGPLTSSLVAAMVLPLVGKWVDRTNPAMVGVIAMAGLGLSFLFAAFFIDGLLTFLVFSALTALMGVGSTALPFSRLILHGFARGRGIALGFVLTGTGFGAIVIPLVLIPIIASQGWQSGFLHLAGAVLLASAVVALLLAPALRRPGGPTIAVPADRHDGPSLWLSRPFLLIAAIFFLASIGVVSVIVHFVPMLRDAGISTERAAQLAALIGFSSIAGRLLVGWLLDRFAPEALALAIFALVIAGLLLLALGPTAMALPGGVITGFAVGAELDLLAFLVSRHFAPSLYGRAYGGVFGLFMVGGAIGPGMAGLLHDWFGSYQASLLASAGCVVIAAIATLVLWRSHPTALSSGHASHLFHTTADKPAAL